MSHQRGVSTLDGAKEPHSVSLKVLRLSRPSLSVQHPLPLPTPRSTPSPKPTNPPHSASHAYPSSQRNDPFILSPLLTLPPAFGSAYVGETFSCTLCANNELLPNSTTPRTISNVRIEAEMKIPSEGVPVSLVLGPSTPPKTGDNTSEDTEDESEKREDEKTTGGGVDLGPAETLQKIVNFDLKEEGSHVLSVTVTYTETTPTSGRVRTFRKLYQFVCKACMVVRTKAGALPTFNGKGRKWALEAQLENVGEDTLTLDGVVLECRDGFQGTGLNWEGDAEEKKPVIGPGDVQQVCFLVEELGDSDGGRDGQKRLVDGKLIFGILSLSWRGGMGNRGALSTGGLGVRIT